MTITGFEQDAITRRVVGQSWYIEYEPEFSDRTLLARKQSYQSDWCARRRLLLFFRVHQKFRCANTGCSSQHINVESICVHHNVILHSHRTAPHRKPICCTCTCTRTRRVRAVFRWRYAGIERRFSGRKRPITPIPLNGLFSVARCENASARGSGVRKLKVRSRLFLRGSRCSRY